MSVVNPRIIMVSNRLPIQLKESEPSGDLLVQESPGGLVRALGSVMRRQGDVWIGWPGISGEVDLDHALEASGTDLGYRLDPVTMTAYEYEQFYKGFSNEVIWPLFHDLHSYCHFDERFWNAYLRINERYADHVQREARQDDLVWVHDYHLMMAAPFLRARGVTAHMAFFLHIPFPGPDVYRLLPWRDELLDGLLHYDLIGFQTPRDLNNFLQTLRTLRADVIYRRSEDLTEIYLDNRLIRAGAFPIGIDVDEIRQIAASAAVEDRIGRLDARYQDTTVMLGVDRLDYTKGIPNRLRAYQRALRDHPELREEIVFIQHVAPSRESVPGYSELRDEVEALVSEINGQYGTFDWTPVQYLYNNLDFTDLIALYRRADIALVTPLKDGMNLVSMEYCAAQQNDPGVLILSEFAGAAHCGKDAALLVNPHDTRGVATAIARAATMPYAERYRRNQAMMQAIRAHDVFKWVSDFLDVGFMERPAPEAAHGLIDPHRTANLY